MHIGKSTPNLFFKEVKSKDKIADFFFKLFSLIHMAKKKSIIISSRGLQHLVEMEQQWKCSI